MYVDNWSFIWQRIWSVFVLVHFKIVFLCMCLKVSNVSSSNCSAQVDYDVACKYTVRVQMKYEIEFCGMENDSEISEPSFYGTATPFWSSVFIFELND